MNNPSGLDHRYHFFIGIWTFTAAEPIMAKNLAFSTGTDAMVTSSYDGFPVHEKMIKDEVRTRSYLDAMENNPDVFKGKTVMDIGCGTGILSL